ncbi:ATP-binding protein [Pseudomonadota bacterium]
MNRFLPPDYSFAPLLALVPGLMMLAAFDIDGSVTPPEAVLSGLVIIAGAAWAGLRQARTFSEPVIKVDTSLASAILDALPDPVVLLDKRRRVIAANRAAEELLGEGMHGRDVCLVLRQPEAQEAITIATDGKETHADASVLFDGAVRRHYQLQAMAVPVDEALSVRAVVALHEVTALKRAEDMRADFVANVSHELRSPLSALTGFIETLQTTAQGDSQAQERFLTIMDGEAGRMTRLIDDLLSLSRIEVNEHIRPQDPVALDDLLNGVAQTVEIRAAKKSMTLDIALPDGLPQVSGDADQLREVFQNLIENAIKYGSEETSVSVRTQVLDLLVETGGSGVEVAIEDRGEGIAAEHLPRLTERFYRIDKGRSRAMGGTGLGLAIVKHIVNRHRGRLLIDSRVGHGTVFKVQLPTFQPPEE